MCTLLFNIFVGFFIRGIHLFIYYIVTMR
jgi:hypothetical protein